MFSLSGAWKALVVLNRVGVDETIPEACPGFPAFQDNARHGKMTRANALSSAQ
ncbi:MAG: hypothetical protein LBK01_02125 [Burkholderiaceae bacterium]|nr:hypothetical protein [Burkholderiaceae bacterium]